MTATKPTQYAISIVLRSGHRPGQFLIVKRPNDDQDLPGSWGLPTTTLQPQEAPEACARRVCREKLGCTGEPLRFMGAMHQSRPGYNLVLMEIEMILIGTRLPQVSQATSKTTLYTKQKWVDQPEALWPSARNGSCCSAIFLTDQGLLNRQDWQLSL